MPKVRMGNVGDFQTIPFDADAIAELMQRGYSVFRDDDTPEDVFRQQDNLVRGAINYRIARKQWGDQKLAPEYKRFNLNPLDAPPSLNEDDPFSMRIGPRGLMGGDYLNIKPNPFITNMPEIDANELMAPENRRKKKTWEL